MSFVPAQMPLVWLKPVTRVLLVFGQASWARAGSRVSRLSTAVHVTRGCHVLGISLALALACPADQINHPTLPQEEHFFNRSKNPPCLLCAS